MSETLELLIGAVILVAVSLLLMSWTGVGEPPQGPSPSNEPRHGVG